MKKILLIFLTLILSSCSKPVEHEGFNVVTSFFPYHSMANYLADESINLVNIMPLNMEVHDFEPSPKDLVLLENADLLIVHGDGLEDWLDTVLKSIKNPNLKVLVMADYVELNTEDPHTWLSPKKAFVQFKAIKDAFVSLNPEESNTYNDKYDKLKINFEDLIQSYESLETYRGQSIIVDHLAYSHLLSPYGINQKSVFKRFNSDEASAIDIEKMIEFIKENSIHSIFETNNTQSKVSDVLIKETGIERLRLSTLEKSDGTDDYISLMYTNLESLKKGLE